MNKRNVKPLSKHNRLWRGALVMLLWCSAPLLAHAQCGVTMSCGGDGKLPPRCEGVCFESEQAAKEYEKKNNCVVQNKCTYAVNAVKNELKKIPRDNPTQGFYRNQDCIADKSCSSKAQLDSSKWIDEVVYDFIMPLVDEQGEWRKKKQECLNPKIPIGAGLQCQNLMAEYHISADLQASLNKNGCGTQKDWDQIGSWLEGCIKKGVQEDMWPGFQWLGAQIAARVVKSERDKVRENCIADRKSRGLPIEENK